jgi:putative sterol carrier protein
MAIPFPSDGWVKALMTKLNESGAYREAARHWEGDFYFIVVPDGGAAHGSAVTLYMDLWHGECRDAYEVLDPAARTPEFVIEAPLSFWRKVLNGRLDPIQALVTRQLKLKGQLVKVMRAPRAAAELVRCCGQVETEWPDRVLA